MQTPCPIRAIGLAHVTARAACLSAWAMNMTAANDSNEVVSIKPITATLAFVAFTISPEAKAMTPAPNTVKAAANPAEVPARLG